MPHNRTHRRTHSADRPEHGAALLRVVDAGLAGIVFVLPLCMGGRQALGQFLLLALATVVCAAWAARQAIVREPRWRSTTAHGLLLAGVMVVVVQLLPLGESWLVQLSPQMPRLLPLWMSTAGEMQIDSWNQLSLAPDATREGLFQWLAYSALFVVTVQHIASTRDLERLLRWVAWSTVAMASFGLVQYLASNGKFFWVYQHPFLSTSDGVRGAFSNRNHMAHFLALGLGPLLWWVQATYRAGDSQNSLRSGLAALSVGVVLFAGLMTFSRGGAIALATAATVYVLFAWRASLVSRRFLLAGGGIMLLVAALLAVHGYQGVAGRLDDLASGSIDELDQSQGRRKVWIAVAAAIADFPLLGSGVGTHAEIYHRYFDQPSLTEYTHAESGYLQVAEETGLVGLALLLVGSVMCATWCGGALRHGDARKIAPPLAAVSASLAASAVHSLYDFVWYVPSCAALVALLAACALRLRQLAGDRAPSTMSSALPRWAWAGACGVMALAGAGAAMSRWGAIAAEAHLDRYRIVSRNVTDPQDAADLMLRHFTAIVKQQPRNARAQLALTEACLRQFDRLQQASDNPLSLAAVRDTAVTGGFRNREELTNWLDRALGPRRVWLEKALWHTRAALALCPLQGQGYLYLAELSFLDRAPGTTAAYTNQALAVRPHDGGVLFKAGQEAALAGESARAADYWQRACRQSPAVQGQLIEYLAAQSIPPSFFLEQLQPDHTALQLLRLRYREVAAQDEYRALLRRYAQSAVQQATSAQGAIAAGYWLEAHWLAVELEEHDAAWRHAQAALDADDSNFHVRHTMARYLLSQQRHAEAEQHLKWCLGRKPDDADLRAALETAARGRIDTQTQTSLNRLTRQ